MGMIEGTEAENGNYYVPPGLGGFEFKVVKVPR